MSNSTPQFIPSQREQAVYRAIELQHAGRVADAARLFAHSAKRGELLFEALYSLGVIAAREGSIITATAMLESALSLKPDNELCRIALSQLNPSVTSGTQTTSASPGNITSSIDVLKTSGLQNNYYCTYFDSNYAPRGLAMINSLCKHDSQAKVFVLCLDQKVESILRVACPHAVPVSLDELCNADPGFKQSKTSRRKIEWYFTATSCFCNYLLNGKLKERDSITYLDADLFFYHSPQPLHRESESSCAQIVEHRFPPSLASLIRYGRFNVGWIKFTNTSTGRRLVSDYRSDCLDWCFDRLEGALFADQKYLDYWPDLYPDVSISRHIGANVAAWNIGQYTLSFGENNLPYVDNEELLFYHFHGVGRDPTGNYFVKGNPALAGALSKLYTDYFVELRRYEQQLLVHYKLDFQEIRYADIG